MLVRLGGFASPINRDLLHTSCRHWFPFEILSCPFSIHHYINLLELWLTKEYIYTIYFEKQKITINIYSSSLSSQRQGLNYMGILRQKHKWVLPSFYNFIQHLQGTIFPSSVSWLLAIVVCPTCLKIQLSIQTHNH